MNKFVIKKRIPLDFLGDDYKEAYLVFRSIPLKDFEQIIDNVTKAEGQDPKESLKLMFEYIKTYFHSGKFPDDTGALQEISGDDLAEFIDNETAIKCFQMLTGQSIDPKVEPPSTNTSIIEPDSA